MDLNDNRKRQLRVIREIRAKKIYQNHSFAPSALSEPTAKVF
jgi:hypothetical protein